MNIDRITQILNIKDEFLMNHEFRRYWRSKIRENISELPSVSSIAIWPALDESTIVKLNQLMSTEEKKNFLTNILKFKNIDFNIYYLILNSSDEVKNYLIDILTHPIYGMSVLTLHFYEIANIYLYTLANSELHTTKDILEHLKNGLLLYDPKALDFAYENKINQDILFSQNKIHETGVKNTDEDNILDILNLKTEEQLEENKNKFFQKVEDNEYENKKLKQIKILKILGITVVCQMVLVAFGFPPLSRIVTKVVTNIFDSDN